MFAVVLCSLFLSIPQQNVYIDILKNIFLQLYNVLKIQTHNIKLYTKIIKNSLETAKIYL